MIEEEGKGDSRYQGGEKKDKERRNSGNRKTAVLQDPLCIPRRKGVGQRGRLLRLSCTREEKKKNSWLCAPCTQKRKTKKEASFRAQKKKMKEGASQGEEERASSLSAGKREKGNVLFAYPSGRENKKR